MEVFLRNLPTHLSEDKLKDLLDPFLKRLHIADYLCEKPKRKQIGNITFLSRLDGEKFLKVHGEERICTGQHMHQRHCFISKLILMKVGVFCKISNRDPQPFALKSLALEAEQHEDRAFPGIDNQGPVALSYLLGSSCGYCTFADDRLVYVPEVRWPEAGTLKFTKRSITVKMTGQFIISIPINTVIELVWFSDGSLTLTLSTVPQFFSTDDPDDPPVVSLRNLGISAMGGFSSAEKNRLCALGNRHVEIVGQCLVYQFMIPQMDLPKRIAEIKSLEITVVRYDLSMNKAIPVKTGAFHLQLVCLKRMLAEYTREGSLPFEILFQLQALAYNAYLHPTTVLGLAAKLQQMFKKSKENGKRPLSSHSIQKMFDMIDWPRPFGDPAEFEVKGLVELLKQNEQEIQDGFSLRRGLFDASGNMARIFRVMVTPSRITLHGPELEPKNRILRKFPNHHDYFIRVQFCDENGQDVHFNPRVNNDYVSSRFKHILANGIEIAGRTYTFLGFSHSSLRSHSAWFSAPFFDDDGHLQTYFTIITAVGRFSNFTSPARCAARIGQAFSDTPFAVDIRQNKIQVTEIPDVISSDGKRTFSDGVGTVSWDAVESIWPHVSSSNGSPTSFQIRLGGAKGMLALDSRLLGSIIQIRPSMIKFPTDDMKNLEICNMASKPMPFVLNRQVIKIMEDMGVPESWFIGLQETQVNYLRSITSTPLKTARFIRRQNVGDSIRLSKLFRRFCSLGFDYKNDLFLRSVVEAVVLRELRLLKHRARIPVEKGMTLFGVMDETGYLQENQVFITYETMRDRYAAPPGPCRLLVTRCPALYDGDVQVVENIVPPEDHSLREHANCIVFSQRGRRDLPSQLSGGDLDGDLYHVIWDEAAIPMRVFEPADYPRVGPFDIGRQVERKDMANFFVDFMNSDRLGVIAKRHMILADQMSEGTRHPDCKMLAELHSTAVDFSKTGIPVEMQQLPRVMPYRPDFMAPGPMACIVDKLTIELESSNPRLCNDEDEDSVPVYKYYKSLKILGKLYRAIDEEKIWNDNIRANRSPQGAAFWEHLLRFSDEQCLAFGPVNWIQRSDEASHIRSAYEDALFSAMNNFSEHPINPLREIEVFTGHIFNKTGVQTHRQRERSIKLKDEFGRIASWIMGLLRRHGNNIVPLTGYETELDALELCLACVHIGCEPVQPATSRTGKELQSFKVVAICALLAELELFEKGQKSGGFVGVR